MRLSKWGYYADLVVYPVVVLALTLVSFRSPHSRFFGVFLLCSLSGMAGWTFVEYAMHRFVLHLIRAAAQMHDMHHASPAAFVGPPGSSGCPWPGGPGGTAGRDMRGGTAHSSET